MKYINHIKNTALKDIYEEGFDKIVWV